MKTIDTESNGDLSSVRMKKIIFKLILFMRAFLLMPVCLFKTLFVGKKSTGKNILVIEAGLPYKDRDGASRQRWEMLLLIRKLGYNVSYLDTLHIIEPAIYGEIPVHNKEVGVFSLLKKILNYRKGQKRILKEMKKNGIRHLSHLHTFKIFRRFWAKRNAKKIDYVFMCHPENYRAFTKLGEFKYSKVIYEVCDIYHLRFKAEYDLTGCERVYGVYKKYKELEEGIFESPKIDTILSVSQKEVELIKKFAPGKQVLTIPVRISDFSIEPNYSYEDRKDILFLGAHNRCNLDAVEFYINEILPHVDKGIKLKLAGSAFKKDDDRYISSQIEVLGPLSNDELKDIYSFVRITIIPIRFGAGVKGKTVEALSSKIPIVSTSFGLEGIPNIEEVYSSIDSPKEFAEEINKMYFDRSRCEELGSKGYECVKKYISIENAEKTYSEIFSK